ncbi:MAG TPA: hypothetical protein VGM92_14540 [Candidatus Kapabacteria bacterium]|jgi:hypothetical protein
MIKSFEEKKARLLEKLDKAHKGYYEAATFGGPSLYFHSRALEAARSQDRDRFTEMSYAMLASWGMHHMGPKGSKMRDFKEFRSSIEKVWSQAMSLQEKTPSNLGTKDWNKLKEIFYGIDCMKSGTKLVGNSKIMAHLIPKLIPPVDRHYTLRFLFGNTQITNGDNEWKMLEQMLKDFFYPFVEDPSFAAKVEKWSKQKKLDYKWDTSQLKIVDNLIIGFSKI